jgi:hypothetical protein
MESNIYQRNIVNIATSKFSIQLYKEEKYIIDRSNCSCTLAATTNCYLVQNKHLTIAVAKIMWCWLFILTKFANASFFISVLLAKTVATCIILTRNTSSNKVVRTFVHSSINFVQTYSINFNYQYH